MRLRRPHIAMSAVVWLVLGAIYFLVPLIATLLFSLKDAQTGKCCSLSAYGVILHDPQFWSFPIRIGTSGSPVPLVSEYAVA